MVAEIRIPLINYKSEYFLDEEGQTGSLVIALMEQTNMKSSDGKRPILYSLRNTCFLEESKSLKEQEITWGDVLILL